jgi:uncharacterized damage-inducible protein DinB
MVRQNLTKVLDEIDLELKGVLNYLSQYSNNELNKKPSADAWSVNQILYHLILSEEGSLAFIKKKIQHQQGPIKKGGAASRLRALLLSTSLKQPFKLTAPEPVSADLPEESDFEALKKRWLDSRVELRAYLSSIDQSFLEAEVYKHPVAGKMDIWGMLSFFESHVLRHEKQIRKTIRSVEDYTTTEVEEVIETKDLKLQPAMIQNS